MALFWKKDSLIPTTGDEIMEDNVNSPKHYTTGAIEVINFIEDKKLSFHRGNAVRYIVRAGLKNPDTEIEDLEKAKWYLTRELEQLKSKEKKELTKVAIAASNLVTT